MKYEEYRKTLSEATKNALDLVFSFAGKIDEELFFDCYELAKQLQNLKEENIKNYVKKLNKIPCSYVRAILIIAKHINKKDAQNITKLKSELNAIYIKDFQDAIKKKNCNLVKFNNVQIQKYLDLKVRLIDEVEIIFIAKSLGLKIDDIIGDYVGEDLATVKLNNAMKNVRKNKRTKEVEQIIKKTLNHAKGNKYELNNIKHI